MTYALLFCVMPVLSAGCLVGGHQGDAGRDNQVNLMDPRRMVAAHNSWRAKVGVAGLRWSPLLENKAIAWANKLQEDNGCRMRHSGPGENLYWASAARTSISKDGKEWQVVSRVQEVSERQVVDSWGSEEQWYSHQGNSCNAPAGKSCGHYTQLVWQGSTEVGCGKALCPDNSQIWVCNYAPAGNVIGQSPY
jgi:pathogenesis-related protein 1